MTRTLVFELAPVVDLAEHAVACTRHVNPAGPALLLSQWDDGIWLTSNGVSGPAHHTGARTTLAAAAEQTPAPSRPLPALVPDDTPVLVAEIPLHAHVMAHLRDGVAAGFTTFTLHRADEGPVSTARDITISRRRTRI